MIFYRLAILKLIKYFQLDQLFKEDELRMILLNKKPKQIEKPKLKINKNLDLVISILLSIISALVCLSIPYAALTSPCEPLKERGMMKLYVVAKYLADYVEMIDRLIIALSIILIVVSTYTIYDAIMKTEIDIDPWMGKGKGLPLKYPPLMRHRYKYEQPSLPINMHHLHKERQRGQ